MWLVVCSELHIVQNNDSNDSTKRVLKCQIADATYEKRLDPNAVSSYQRFVTLFIKNGKKLPIFCDFLHEVHSYGKTFQMVQGDCQCGPFTTNIILLKFEDF